MIPLADLTKAFDVSRNTVKNWGTEYADYLSEHANPEPGKTRQYTLDDACVLSLVAAMRSDNASYEEIAAALASGDRGMWPLPSATSEDTQEDQPQNMQLITQLTARASQLEGQIGAISEERDMLRGKVDDLQASLMDAEKRAAAAEAEANILKALREETAAPVPVSFWDRIRGKG